MYIQTYIHTCVCVVSVCAHVHALDKLISPYTYCILPVNSRGYYKQVEIGAATNHDFYIEIARKA